MKYPLYALLTAAAAFVLPPGIHAAIPGVKVPANPARTGASAGSPASANPPGQVFALETQKWWLWDFSLPAPLNPTVTPGADCQNGQTGKVWFLYGGPPTVTCHVPFGKSVFFPIVNTECSDLEVNTPFYGATAFDRALCAKTWIDNVTNLSATIDGIDIRNFSLFRMQSGDFRFDVPPNNILGVPGPNTGFSSADGYYVFLPLVVRGVHLIHITGTFHDPFDAAHPVVFALDTLITLIADR